MAWRDGGSNVWMGVSWISAISTGSHASIFNAMRIVGKSPDLWRWFLPLSIFIRLRMAVFGHPLEEELAMEEHDYFHAVLVAKKY